MLHEPGAPFPGVPFPKGCLIIYIHIVSPAKLNQLWCLLDLNDSQEETQA